MNQGSRQLQPKEIAFSTQAISPNRGIIISFPAKNSENVHLNSGNFEELRDYIGKRIRQGKVFIIIDCVNVTYISSNGLSVILGSHSQVQEWGGSLVLCRPTDKVRHLIEILGFNRNLNMFDTEDEARNHLNEIALQNPNRS